MGRGQHHPDREGRMERIRANPLSSPQRCALQADPARGGRAVGLESRGTCTLAVS